MLLQFPSETHTKLFNNQFSNTAQHSLLKICSHCLDNPQVCRNKVSLGTLDSRMLILITPHHAKKTNRWFFASSAQHLLKSQESSGLRKVAPEETKRKDGVKQKLLCRFTNPYLKLTPAIEKERAILLRFFQSENRRTRQWSNASAYAVCLGSNSPNFGIEFVEELQTIQLEIYFLKLNR